MKLHLPKLLHAAVLAVVMGGQALGLTVTSNTEVNTFLTSGTYDGALYDYSDGELILNGSPSSLSVTFTLDYDAFEALTENTDLLYVNTTGSIWGFRATADGTVTGKWKANEEYADGATIMSASDFSAYVTGEGNNRVVEGLKATLQSDTTPGTALKTSTDATVFSCAGLRQANKTFSSAYINTALITSLTIQDVTGYTYTNTAGTWQRTFHVTGVTDAAGGYLKLNGGESGSAAGNTNPIVVGGAGQLHLEAWGQGTVNLDDDIYMGSSTNTNVNNFGVIRISNDGDYGANLSGNIYLVEDSSIKGTGSKAIVLSGTITDKGVVADSGTVDGNYTLTVGGAGIEISGAVDLGGLNVVQGYSSGGNNFAGTTVLSSTDATLGYLSIGTNATLTVTGNLTLGSTVANTGTLILNGGLVLKEEGSYALYEADSESTFTHGANGYMQSTGSKYYAIQGSGDVTIDSSASVMYGGQETTLSQVDGGYVFTAGQVTDMSTFYINSGTVTANSETYTNIDGANKYVLATDTEFDVNGQYFAGKTFDLGANATLKNSGSALDGNNKMFADIVLTGDATVNAENNMGLQNMTSADASVTDSSLTLNGHTLTKSGGGAFFLTATQVTDAGTIKIGEGMLQVGVEVGQCANADTNAANVRFQLDGGTLNICESGNTLTAKSLSGTGTVSGNGVLKLENTETAASHAITGNVKVGALYLLGNDSYTINGNLTVSGAENGYAKIMAAGLTLGSGTHSINRLDLSVGGTSLAKMVLESGAHLTAGAAAYGAMWLGDDASITVKDGASFSVLGVKAEAKNNTTDAEITFLATSNDTFGLTNSNYQFKDAKVSYAAAESGTTLGFKLLNSELVNTGSGTLTASHTGNVLSGIDAAAGNINILNSQEQELSSLSIGAGKTVGLYTGAAAPTMPTSADEATVTTSSLTAGTDATLNANLVLANGATVTMAGALTMGSTVTLGTGMTLAGDLVSTIKGMSEDGTVNLFTGVDALYLGDSTTASGTLDATSGVNLDTYFNFEGAADYYLGYDGQNVYAGVMQAVPEPTTATLSLLALAALAARRRRR